MRDCKDQSKCLASLAVFRGLYNSKKDIYGVISEFLKEIIISESKHQFALTEITKILNSTFDFYIPEAVVQTALKRLAFIEKEHGTYLAKNLLNEKRTDISEKQKELQASNNAIIENLFTFIEEKKGSELSDSEKEKIVHSLCSFLLDDSNGVDYSEFISAFIISNKQDISFTERLNLIKEGVVLYSGIKYNSNINDVGSWSSPLTIYIETEILFHFAGYNGELYRTLFLDFFAFIKEINSKAGKKIIQLKYFHEVKDEIERFFKKAEYIIEGKDKANPSVTAMRSILDGCDSIGDIVEKKTMFYELLSSNGIKEDDYNDYFEEKNYQYNIIDQNILDTVSKELEIEEISENLRFLNFISIHRKDSHSNNFENIKYILLSGNSTTLKIAWHDEIKLKGNVPLATNLSFLTNKFWFKLNKGFGKNNYPKTFDIVTKAQIVLSTQLNETVSAKFDELQLKYKDGKLTEQQAVATIANLRSQARKPEEIEVDDIAVVLDSITEDSIEKYLEEQEHFKNKARMEAEENVLLKQNLTIKEAEIYERDKKYKLEQEEKRKKELELIDVNLDSKNHLLLEKEQNKYSLEKQKVSIDEVAQQKYNWFKFKLFVLIFSYYLVTYYLIWKNGWDVMEKWTYIINGTVPFLFSVAYIFIKEKSFNFLKYLEIKKNDVFNKTYTKFNFAVNRIKELEEEIFLLRVEYKRIKVQRDEIENKK